jgi:hypothetical protein
MMYVQHSTYADTYPDFAAILLLLCLQVGWAALQAAL